MYLFKSRRCAFFPMLRRAAAHPHRDCSGRWVKIGECRLRRFSPAGDETIDSKSLLQNIRGRTFEKICFETRPYCVGTLLVILLVLFALLKLMPGTPFNDEKLNEAQKLR